MKSIRVRIILLSIFALTFLGLAIFKQYDDVHSGLENSKESLKVIKKITKLSQIVHSLQQERGLSAANLAKDDDIIRNKLLKRRSVTDSQFKTFIGFLDSSDNQRLAIYEKELNVIRKKVDAGIVSWQIVKKFYTREIDKILDRIRILIGSTNHTKHIYHKYNAVYDLAHARENLGLLRAIISRYYQKSSLTLNESLDVNYHYIEFESRYKSFQLDLSSSSDFKKIKNRIDTGTFFSVKNKIQSILKKDYTNLHGNTMQWWNESTLIIDTMHEVERNLLNQVQEYTENVIKKNKRNIFTYFIIAITAFLIVSLLTFFTVFRILQALSILINTLDEVEHTEDFGIRIETKPKDEFGKLSFSINNLLDYTDKIIKQKDELATIDLLTGVMNRRSFMTSVNKEIARSRRYETPLSLLFCDIDKFKSINDEYGHSIGDQVLRVFAQTIKSNIRQSDILARWGGEEFVILAPETDESDAVQLADNLRKRIMEIKVSPVEQITCSFGVAQLKKDESFEELYERADLAVYDAKNSGRNKVCTSNG